MELLRWKARLSVLWVFMAVGMSATKILELMMPGAIEEMMAGESEGMMVGYALFWVVPLVMAVLCLTLKDALNRRLNFVLGILLVLFFVVCEIVGHATWSEESISVALWLLTVVGLAVSFSITWFAWKWPKREV